MNETMHLEEATPGEAFAFQSIEEEHAALFAAILRGSHDGVIVLDEMRETITFTNDAICIMAGYPSGSLIGMPHRTLHPNLDHVPLQAGNMARDIPLSRRDGSFFYCDIRADNMEIQGRSRSILFYKDITERMQAETKMRASKRQCEAILDQANVAIFVENEREEILEVNKMAQFIFGYSHEELTKMKTRDLLIGGRTPLEIYQNPDTLLDRPVERLARRSDGTEFWIEIHISPVRSPSSTCFLSIVQDVTEKKLTEMVRQESEERLKAMWDAVQVGMALVDGETHTITAINPAGAEIIGRPDEEILGRPCGDYLCMKDPKECPVTQRKESARNVRCTLKGHPSGEPRSIEKNVCPVYIGGKLHVLESFVDVTAYLEGERQLLRAKEGAEAADRAKSEFLANMSHEIRTPLNAVIGFADLLRQEDLTSEQKESAEAISKSGDSLLMLIDDLLDLSKIEADRVELEEIPFDLRDLATRACEIAKGRRLGKNVDVICDYSMDFSWVLGDPMRTQQVLLNLLSNAVKFTDHGQVLLQVAVQEKMAESTRIEISVSDTGIGIPQDRLEAIFESFTQADGSTTRHYGGTGLGLAISRRLVTLMGGELTVTSLRGEGSTFSFVMELKHCASIELSSSQSAVAEKPSPGGTTKMRKILLVEDNVTNQAMATKVLEKLGCVVEVAEDGIEAVRKAEEATYDLIFMDMQMPKMGGLDATQILRRHGLETPIVAMTANAMSEDKRKCLEAGMNDYLSKPIRTNEVWEMLDRFSRESSEADLHRGRREELEIMDELFQGTFPEAQDVAEELGIDLELYVELAGIFNEDTEQKLLALREAMENDDRESSQQLAHSVKGSALNMRLEPIAIPAKNIEMAARSGDDLSHSMEDLEMLQRAFNAFKQRQNCQEVLTPSQS